MFSSRIATFAMATFAALLFAGQVSAAPAIATDPFSACGPPNNGNHHEGSSCKYVEVSDSGPVVSGTCKKNPDGVLVCV